MEYDFFQPRYLDWELQSVRGKVAFAAKHIPFTFHLRMPDTTEPLRGICLPLHRKM